MKLGIFAAALLVGSPAFAAQLISNGNFEADSVGSGSISGWQVVTGPGDGVAIEDGYAYQGCCGGFGSAANLTNRFVSYGAGESGTNALVSQSFHTTASAYNVSFDVGAFGGAQTITASAIDAVTNLVLGTLSVTRPGTSNFDTTFGTSLFSFVGAGNDVKLSFTAAGSPTGSSDAFLDNVSVIGAAVPEPASWSLMLGGFGLIGGAMRSRRKANAHFA